MNDIEACQLCGQKALKCFFERNEYPIWGGPVIAGDQKEHLTYASLRVGICDECGFMSLISPKGAEVSDLLYGDFYASSNPVCEDPESLTDWRVLQLLNLIDEVSNGETGTALEIASYDGQFLYQLRKRGWKIAGCEPNPIGQKAAKKYGFDVKQSYFRKQLYPAETFDLVVCRFVLEHVPEPLEFLGAAREVLKPGGRIFIEVPDCADRVINRVLGSFVPEHVSYFCKESLAAALSGTGFGAPEFRIYQGGIIAFATRPQTISEVGNAITPRSELISGAASFEGEIAKRIDSLRSIAEQFVSQRKSVAIYGANTQTIEYFNRGGLDESAITYIVDDDPYKQGLELVGTKLPVYPFQKLVDSPVDAVIVSAYLSQEKMATAVREKCGPATSVIRFYPEPSVGS